MLVVALRMFVAPRITSSSAAGREEPIDDWRRVLGAGLAVGVMTGFFGVGGGFLIVPALVLALGLSMRLAVGTSLVIIAINSASGLAAHLRYGSLDLAVVGLFALGGAAGALLGATLGGRVDEQRLQRVFAGIVALVGLWLIAGNLPGTSVIS
jgi:uncharacterized membrane protein YfcA